MRYRPLPPEEYVENRRRFAATLPPGACCVIHANDVPQTNADGTSRFIQNSDLFWLTGIDQEDTILLLFPDSPASRFKEMLFVRNTDARTAIWEGNKLSREEASALSGIEEVLWTSQFEGVLKRVLSQAQHICGCTDHHPAKELGPVSRNMRFAQWCREHYPLHTYSNASPALGQLRMIKSDAEVRQMQHAVEITAEAFKSGLATVRPGAWEYEVEAACIHTMIRRGARGFAYEPIIASGANSCVLHYIANDQQMRDGDLLLMDIGASYGNYAADLTRTVPVSGSFTDRQEAVYKSVLSLLRKATALMQPGMSLDTYHDEVNALADEALVDLGLVTIQELKLQDATQPMRNRYFLHRTAHFLGLDVHDAGDPHAVLAPGMVLTCEPGIYIREEGLGIRLENNILITATGNTNLMSEIPVEPAEIESLLSQKVS